ncbi:efflux RND transporter periplasmic adaptor subunit [Fodinisporobacter ferrooxydans]|uniref:Efflux RND transporter periplasmic adaptor subunit n=1 Tax=Fodinisporobacter ferrooxydans TaxID=2901836 RepID=A0ABY4CNY1_9BACL|nr:efflux RND transporter periplasmic adaptor subunit [Alicyclobacillaceae bacterium MYW30-H2]
MKKIIFLNVILILIILLGGGALGYYVYQQNTYISTDDAQVAGDIVPVNTRAAGNLTTWNVKTGDNVKANDSIGTITAANGQQTVQAPIDGTIIKNNVIVNQPVSLGQSLAMETNLNKLYVTANIEETYLNDLKNGQAVDVWVDAFPDVKLQGTIAQIGLATNSSFSLLPTSSTSGTYTKVMQRIPIKIVLSGYGGKPLAPGMSATVQIHR